MLLCYFQHGWIAPHNYNDNKGQINDLVFFSAEMIGEHTDSDELSDRVLNGETTYREVSILQVTSRTMANLWLLFKLV